LKLLIDTHAALWWLADDERFSGEAAHHLADAGNLILLSAAVVWEVAIKRSLGKLAAPDGFAATLVSGGVQPLAVTVEHAGAVERLPWRHRDPFDRQLVAQAQIEGAAIVSGDGALRPYGVTLVW
jgi:PIN domain nuclease of toxin-antitoxin system